MSTITINRGETTSIPFSITDSANGLLNKRVTWAIAAAADCVRLLRKVGGLPGSTADITITSQTAGAIAGTINMLAADYALLTADTYAVSLWVDDGAGNDQCVTTAGIDTLQIIDTVAREA